jgi:sec-independent protein translocase protein TatB
MFGIDFSEILLIFGIALVVLGPERLPKLAHTVGRWIGRARAMARQFREQLEQETNGLQQGMDLGPEFGGRATPNSPNIRPPAHSSPSPAPTDASFVPPGAAASAEVSVTDLTAPTTPAVSPMLSAAPTDPMAAAVAAVAPPIENPFEYGLAHTYPGALHPSPAAHVPASPAAAATGAAGVPGAAASQAEAPLAAEPRP